MIDTGRQTPTTAAYRVVLLRWILLLAVMAGIVAMHVLSTGGQPGHGSMAMPMAAVGQQQQGATDTLADAGHPAAGADHGAAGADHGAAGAVADPAGEQAAPQPAMPAHAAMTACVLFLIVGGTLLLLALAWRAAGLTGSPLRRLRWTARRRRGPPASALHLRLGVIRV